MKCVIFVLTFAFVLGTLTAEFQPKNCAEEKILDFLKKFQGGGLSNLPSLQSITVPSTDGAYDGYGIKVSFKTGEMKLTGVQNVIVRDLSVNPKDLKMSTTVSFPLLDITSENYSLKGKAYMLYTLKGSGLLTAQFQNVTVTVETQLLSNGTVMYIKDIDMSFSIGALQLHLQDSSWPINEVLDRAGLKIFESFRSVIVKGAIDSVKPVINEYLSTVSSEDSNRVLDLLYVANGSACVGVKLV